MIFQWAKQKVHAAMAKLWKFTIWHFPKFDELLITTRNYFRFKMFEVEILISPS